MKLIISLNRAVDPAILQDPNSKDLGVKKRHLKILNDLVGYPAFRIHIQKLGGVPYYDTYFDGESSKCGRLAFHIFGKSFRPSYALKRSIDQSETFYDPSGKYIPLTEENVIQTIKHYGFELLSPEELGLEVHVS